MAKKQVPGTRLRPRPPEGRGGALFLALVLALGLATCQRPEIPVGLVGGPEPVEWVRSPDSLGEMRALEQQIVAISPHTIGVTVGVRVGENQGSGVLVSPDGLVLTAWHVIGEANVPATIYLPDGRRMPGVTLESNPGRDTGMVRIEGAGPWPYADVLRESDAPVGTWCIATGHPGGFERGRAPVLRVGRVVSRRSDFLQSDCPIFSGDSGGPLFDLTGRVIGIHSRIRENLSFNLHVPSSAFLRDWNYLTASGPLLGIRGEDAPVRGALVTEVFPEQPADRVDLLEGDVILAFEGQAVEGMTSLAQLVRDSDVGQKVRLLVLRGQREFTVEPELARRERP